MQVILKAKPLLTRCVPAHAHGKLTLQITIDPKGHVQHAKVHESTLHGAHVEACVTKVVHRLRFSPPEDGKVMIVNFPLMFRGD